MNKNQVLQLIICKVSFHKEERMVQGSTFGVYDSSYIASFDGYPNGIASVDKIAATLHSEWDRKTDNRAKILSKELKGKVVSVRITDIFGGKDCFEGEII